MGEREEGEAERRRGREGGRETERRRGTEGGREAERRRGMEGGREAERRREGGGRREDNITCRLHHFQLIYTYSLKKQQLKVSHSLQYELSHSCPQRSH